MCYTSRFQQSIDAQSRLIGGKQRCNAAAVLTRILRIKRMIFDAEIQTKGNFCTRITSLNVTPL